MVGQFGPRLSCAVDRHQHQVNVVSSRSCQVSLSNCGRGRGVVISEARSVGRPIDPSALLPMYTQGCAANGHTRLWSVSRCCQSSCGRPWSVD